MLEILPLHPPNNNSKILENFSLNCHINIKLLFQATMILDYNLPKICATKQVDCGWFQNYKQLTHNNKFRNQNKCVLIFFTNAFRSKELRFGTPHVWYEYQMGFTKPYIGKYQIWNKLPQKLDVLITHIPPMGIRDVTHQKQHVGCKRLLSSVQKIQPKVHIFGHIHQSYGDAIVGKTHFYNVCYLDQQYKPKNKPVLIEFYI